MAEKFPIICVTGAIGSGKSTLVDPLAACLLAASYRERNDTNPAYAASLRDPIRWSFESELAFMLDNLENWSRARKANKMAIMERCPADTAAIFGASCLAHGEISEREFRLICRCAELAPSLGGIPDLVVLLSCPVNVAHERVIRRNEEGEETYTMEYLEEIGQRYEDWGRRWSASPVIWFDSAVNDVRVPAVARALASDIRRKHPDLF
jgi:deoxyadenosine/deoxycytidine kinase